MDEPLWITWGRYVMVSLNEGRLPAELQPLSNNPLVVLLYAALYLPVREQPFWMTLELWMARAGLFTLLWLTSFLVARRLPLLQGRAVLVLALLTPVIPQLLDRTSDALYASLAGLVLWQVLGAGLAQSLRRLLLTGGLLGLAALARVDGFALFLVVSLYLTVTTPAGSGLMRRGALAGRQIAAVALPFMLVVGLYIAAMGVSTGSWDIGSSTVSYHAFEQSQGMVYSPFSARGYTEGIPAARALYGTPEENGLSFMRAIARNPGAFLHRVMTNAGNMPVVAATGYGEWLGGLVLLLAAAGALALYRRGERARLMVLALGLAPALPYLVFYYRPAYFQHGFLSVLVLASGGALWIAGSVRARLATGMQRRAAFATVAVAAVALSAATWPARMTALPSLGTTGEEQTAAFLAANYPRETRVLAFSGAVPWMAKMHSPLDWQRLYLLSQDEPSSDDVVRQLRDANIQLVYLDHIMLRTAPALYQAIAARIGQDFELVFATDPDGLAYRVYRFTPRS